MLKIELSFMMNLKFYILSWIPLTSSDEPSIIAYYDFECGLDLALSLDTSFVIFSFIVYLTNLHFLW